MSELPRLMSVYDICKRWDDCPKQTVYMHRKREDFPKPIQTVSGGRFALYLESDIMAYEEKCWWISSEYKRRKYTTWLLQNVINA